MMKTCAEGVATRSNISVFAHNMQRIPPAEFCDLSNVWTPLPQTILYIDKVRVLNQ